jgi:hypothetical protein
MTKEQLKELVIRGEINLTDVIDVVVDINGIIGVGLISFADSTSEYIRSKGRK